MRAAAVGTILIYPSEQLWGVLLLRAIVCQQVLTIWTSTEEEAGVRTGSERGTGVHITIYQYKDKESFSFSGLPKYFN